MNHRLRFLAQKYLCELRWGWELFRIWLSARFHRREDVGMQESPKFQQRQEILRRQSVLRSMLCETPDWILGHVRLGLSELELQQLSDMPLAPRARATVRTSAEAVDRLAEHFGRDRAHRALLEAEFLRASLEFLDRDFNAAELRLKRILEPAHAAQLHERVYRMALEAARYSSLAPVYIVIGGLYSLTSL